MKSKRYKKVLSNIEKNKFYSLSDAFNILKDNNFEDSKNLELSLSIHWNTKQNNLRDFVTIPYPVKREKIAIIDENVPSGLKKKDSIIFVNLEDLQKLINKKKKSWGFDKLLAHSSILDKIKFLSKALSLKRSFPNIKDGTLSSDLEKSVNDFEKGRIELRNDKNGNFHILLGKTTFEIDQIEANYKVIFSKIISLKPLNWKGEYLKSITLSTTMSPGIKILI